MKKLFNNADLIIAFREFCSKRVANQVKLMRLDCPEKVNISFYRILRRTEPSVLQTQRAVLLWFLLKNQKIYAKLNEQAEIFYTEAEQNL